VHLEYRSIVDTQLRVKQVLLGIGGKMSHYDKQREAQLLAEQSLDELVAQSEDLKMYEIRNLSIADYECYINGVYQPTIVDTYIDTKDPDDLYNYMEPEFLDFLKVLKMGAKKHGNANWLNVDGKKSSHKDMHASMFRHLAQSFANQRLDAESGLDHLLHLASRALMAYTRSKRGLIHPEDK